MFATLLNQILELLIHILFQDAGYYKSMALR